MGGRVWGERRLAIEFYVWTFSGNGRRTMSNFLGKRSSDPLAVMAVTVFRLWKALNVMSSFRQNPRHGIAAKPDICLIVMNSYTHVLGSNKST